jgi:hypothetical protein
MKYLREISALVCGGLVAIVLLSLYAIGVAHNWIRRLNGRWDE